MCPANRAISLILALGFIRSDAILGLYQASASGRGQWSEGFSAEFVFTDLASPSDKCSGKIYGNILTLPRGVRQEVACKGRGTIITIWRQDRRTAVSIDTARGIYWKTSEGAGASLHGDGTPGKILPGFIGKPLSARLLGAETIDGRAVDHWQVTVMDRSLGTVVWDYWEDKRLRTCIRALLPGKKEYRLSKVLESRQPASMFTLPRALREVPEPRDSPTP